MNRGGPATELLAVRNLKKHYPVTRGFLRRRRGWVRAVDGVDLTIAKGETLGLVGESGCGKSTLGRVILRLEEPTSGDILYLGESLLNRTGKEMLAVRRKMQIIFQDPYASLNPRLTIGRIIGEGPAIHRLGSPADRAERVRRLMEVVGLRPEEASRYPHEFSGGQRQRVGIARALALQPELLICDEPLSALDVSVQAQVINLLQDLQEVFGLTYLFISHDLSVVRHLSDRVAVMYLGSIVELTDKDELFDHPAHPYTLALLQAVPVADPRAARLRRRKREPEPEPGNLEGPGCRFATRCPDAFPPCRETAPLLKEVSPGHWVKCLRTGG
ncbi:MAG: ABC transporter ATP-binding protein [Deltaproteobacteria bacterium]|nr:ABC transporter ATP-binding protein [Deltaproteobacteria bacterium]